MAGDESARVASAFIDIKARRAFTREEIRRMAQEAGREFEGSFEDESDKEFKRDAPKRKARGKQAGAELGDAAGKEAGKRTSEGLTEGLARTRVRRRKDGEDLGAVLGAAAGAKAGRATSEGLSANLRASYGSFTKDGARLGDVLGAAMGDHAAGLTRKAIRRELDAEAKIRARETALELRAAAAAQRIRERAAASAVRLAAQEGRARVAAEKAAAREAEKIARAAEAAQRARAKRFAALQSSFTRVLSGGGGERGALGLLRRGTSVLGIGALASSLSGLGRLIAGTVGAVTQLSGAFALLPAVGVAAGVGLAAVKIGVHDVGDALSNNADPEKYAESLKKLSPAARSFTKAVVALKPELKALRNEVQEGLFKGLDKQVTALGGRYIPILSKGLTGISKAFNAAGQDVGEFLDKASTGRQVSGIFSDIGRAAGKLAYAAKPATAAVLDLVSTGTRYLPRFAGSITDASKRFRLFVADAKQSGALDRFIQGGIQGFKELGRVVQGAGRILGGVLSAGGGAAGGGLAVLADLLNKVADQIARPEFQRGLGHFFDSFKDAGAAVGGALPKVADALIALEPAASKLVSGSGKALASILTSVASTAEAVAPALNAVASVLSAMAPVAGPVVVSLLALKGVLLAFKGVQAVAFILGRIRTEIASTGTAAGEATGKTDRFRRSLNLGTKALGAFTAFQLGQSVFGQFTKGADASVVSAGKLTEALKRFQSGQDAGSGTGILGKNFGDLGKQLQDAGDPSFGRKAIDNLGRVQSKLTSLLTGGKSDGSGKGGFFGLDTGVSSAGGKQATELAKSLKEADNYLSGLVSGGSGKQAAAFFEQLNRSAVAGGAGVGELASKLPQFRAALSASGGAIDSTTGSVTGLGESIDDLARKTADYATKALAARAGARGYEAALDLASEAAKRNGKTLSDNTAAGRENSEALDQIASSGLAYAQQILDNGGSEAAFQGALKRTRADLVQAGIRFGLSKEKARAYATSILGIPKRAVTTIDMYGIKNAITSAKNLADRLSRIPRTVTSLVRTEYLDVFASEVERDKATARRGGKAYGGLVDPRLGAPRQDNVPLLVSGGEFVVNAHAVASPGVLALLRKINATNQYPQKLAGGGQVARSASVGLNDISNSQPARIERLVAARQQDPAPSQRLHPDDLAALAQLVGAAVGSAMRQQPIVLDSGAIAGAVYSRGGRF